MSNASKSSSMLKTAGTSSKKDNITSSNSYSDLNDEEEDKEEDVENGLIGLRVVVRLFFLFICVFSIAIGDASGSSVDLINNLDAGWILGSLSQELYVGQVYSEVASEVWTELKETYDKIDGSVVFNLMHKINNLKQGDLSMPDYYHKLNSLWREFDILTILPACVCEGRPVCTYDAKSSSTKHTQLIRLMQFLMGLNDVYQPITSTNLAKDPLINVKDDFYVVSREESHRGLHPGSSSTSKVQPAAFIAK
ncbi:hypothetical protein Tco_0800583, partial [Tanacetum coccineum]